MSEQEEKQTPKQSQRQANQDYFEEVGRDVYTGPVTIQQQVTPSEDTGQAALRTAYLHRLFSQTSQMPLTSIDRKSARSETDTRLNLAAIYTALLTYSIEQRRRKQPKHKQPDESEQDLLAERDSHEEHRLSALEMLNRHTRLVLLGDPGSGKSTFVNFVVMCLAGELLPTEECANLALLTAPLPDEKGKDRKESQAWNHEAFLPVLVILRDFAAKGLPPPGQQAKAKHLWNFIIGELQEMMLEEYVPVLQRHLRAQGVLLLLDGLDEVPEANQRRTQIKHVVEDFAVMSPKCRMLITSRTYAYQQQEWRLSGFEEAVLASFSNGQIRRFVDRWYQHIAEMRGQNLENAQGRAELLKRAIFTNDRLHDFAKRPLLLTLMASLHAWRGGSLPEKRGELYTEATDLLLDWWERDKVVRNADGQIMISQPSLTEMLRVGKDRIQRVLSELAFKVHTSQTDMAGAADIPEEDMVMGLMRICRNDDVNPVLLVKYLSDRAGLLVPRGVGVYSFPHRTFQEYLAACHLTGQEDYPDNIAILACGDPNRWREVLLLSAARASAIAPMIWVLAEALCNQPPKTLDTIAEDAWGALLAGQALVETANLEQVSPRNQRKIKNVRDWLVEILIGRRPSNVPFPAVERALAGNILAQLDDLRLGVGLREDGLPDIVWCEVPAGVFLMGSDPEKDKEAIKDEQPQHDVRLSAYHISRYPVTNAHYQAFVEDGAYTGRWQKCWTPEGWEWKEKENISAPESYGGEFDLPNHPVVGVSWYEAVAFCNWLTQRLREQGELSNGPSIRLPTEAEWEKAVRSSDGRIYPWGDEITPELANYEDTGLGATSTVGCFPRGKSPYGCEEMVGNVWEWCLDWFDENYYSDSPKDNPQGPESGSVRVVRGGGWGYDAGGCRSAFRNVVDPDYRDGGIGFRLLRTP